MNAETFFEQIADRIADKVFARMSQGTQCWRSQNGSPLGRRHNAVVRARIERGDPGAAIVGRQHLLSEAALGEELRQCTSQRSTAPAHTSSDAVDLLKADLAALEADNG